MRLKRNFFLYSGYQRRQCEYREIFTSRILLNNDLFSGKRKRLKRGFYHSQRFSLEVHLTWYSLLE